MFRDVNLVFSVLELLILCYYSLFKLDDKFRVLIFFDISNLSLKYSSSVSNEILHYLVHEPDNIRHHLGGQRIVAIFLFLYMSTLFIDMITFEQE